MTPRLKCRGSSYSIKYPEPGSRLVTWNINVPSLAHVSAWQTFTFTFIESFSSSFGSCECVVYDKDCHQDGQDDENGNHHHDHGQDTFSRRSLSSDSPFHFHVNFHFQSSVDPTSWSVIVPLDLAPGHFPASAKSPQAKYEHCNALFTMPSMNIVSKRTLALEDFDILLFFSSVLASSMIE